MEKILAATKDGAKRHVSCKFQKVKTEKMLVCGPTAEEDENCHKYVRQNNSDVDFK